MDLPATTPTSTSFDFDLVRVLHLETTTVCNASCPQCPRENPLLYNDQQHRRELSVEILQNLFDCKFIKQLDKMFMCGNFGDPAAGKHTIEIYKWFREINPNIILGMNTNGGLRTTDWWSRVGKLFSGTKDYVVFSIDGLADTNHIYRRNVQWERVIQNAKAFIDAGGSAHWDMLLFEHNQHQLAQAQNLAKELGFSWFRSKISRRFSTNPISWLNPPTGYNLPKNNVETKIECHALQEKSLYVAATGEILPCCFFGSKIFSRDAEFELLVNSKNFHAVVNTWNKEPYSICSRSCRVTNNKSIFRDQWHTEIQLK